MRAILGLGLGLALLRCGSTSKNDENPSGVGGTAGADGSSGGNSGADGGHRLRRDRRLLGLRAR